MKETARGKEKTENRKTVALMALNSLWKGWKLKKYSSLETKSLSWEESCKNYKESQKFKGSKRVETAGEFFLKNSYNP
jgi:predicted transcriptional regulator